MHFSTLKPSKEIAFFVKSIMVFEEPKKDKNTVLPFFADGYPGLMFQETENGLVVSPHNKIMPVTFLYGQTLKPIELRITGKYKLIVFQLYPFVLKSLFNVTATDITDNCYDLTQLNDQLNISLLRSKKTDKRVEIISGFLEDLFISKKQNLDLSIKRSIQFILDSKAVISVKEICEQLHLTERTFERRFLKEVGITAQKFILIIKFQQSYEQLTLKDFKRLTDIVYQNGFADQSHFIRVFKAFTGKTPKSFID